jgi:hypothetical protein
MITEAVDETMAAIEARLETKVREEPSTTSSLPA